MSKHTSEYIIKLIDEENKHLAKLNEIVVKSLQEEDMIVRKIFRSHKNEKLPLSSRVADRVANFGGSWKFIIFFITSMILWMLYNHNPNTAFDPFPFILLNLALSCLAALQAPVILMSQNRQAEKDRKRDEHEYLINLKAELQVRELNRKIDLLIAEQMKALMEIQEKQLSLLGKIEDRHNLKKKP